MKNKMNFRIGLLLLPLCLCISCSREKPQNLPQDDTISFYSTPELYDLTLEWAGVFSKLNPDVEINVVNASASSVAENLDNSANVSFVSGDFDSEIYDRSLWKVVVGRDVIVPVINSENPLMDQIYQQGISPAEFSRIINNPGESDWGTLLGPEHHAPVNLYVTDEAALHPGLAKFLETDQASMNGIRVADSKDLLAALEGDKYSIGICNITDVIDANKKIILGAVKLLPIDKNGNGMIDFKEDVYADLATFSRGVWIGKYPRALSRNIYSIAASNPTHRSETAFLKWIITGGQVLLDNHGFSHLEHTEQMAQVKWIDSFDGNRPGAVNFTIPKEPNFFSRPFPIIMAFLLMTALMAFSLEWYMRKRVAGIPIQMKVPGLAFNEEHVKSLP
ncbi:MAG: hypothetical protein IMY68_08350, partial [Bacteroidetes bacterium]|nr:hypothetical protein [Bacteroidota bacterium]